jgi:ribosomal protein S18 acetylase RimI-like enzyme
MTMTTACVDWRALPAAAIAPLLAREAAAWRDRLGWDVGPSWAGIEPGRANGRLPGLHCHDDSGASVGWTCFLRHGDILQVAMLVADASDTTRALVTGVLQSAEARSARACAFFVRDAAPGLADTLVDDGFAVAAYQYRTRLLDHPSGPELPAARAWHSDDGPALARLCGRAYRDAGDVRAFAPDGTPAQWLEYVRTLVAGTGCGSLLANASLVVPGRDGRLDAGILTTDLGPGTAHIAQIVVDPAVRGRGLGRGLVDAAMRRAATVGFGRITLLVAETNRAACSLYDSLGFESTHRFIAASR